MNSMQGETHRSSVAPAGNSLVWLLLSALVLDSLEAYSIAGVPLQHCSLAIGVAWLIYRAIATTLVSPPELRLYWFYAGWALLVLGVSLYSGEYARFATMPPYSTTTYETYVGLRYISLFAFVGSLQLFYDAFNNNKRITVAVIVNYGVLVCLAALYLYYAPLLGLPEPPRTRVSTHGIREQAVLFTYYGVQRATGTFREPGTLAHWLIIPLFFSFLDRSRASWIKRFILILVMFLTGGLGAITSISAGAVLSMILAPAVIVKRAWTLALIVLVAAGAIWLSSMINVSLSFENMNLVDVVGSRLSAMAEGGIKSTNRSYIYEYMPRNPPTLFGVGYGNASIEMSRFLNKPIPDSFLSCYLYNWYSGGMVGLVLFCVFLVAPLWRWLRMGAERSRLETFIVAAAFVAILVGHAGIGDEVGLPVACSYACVLAVTQTKCLPGPIRRKLGK